MNVVGPERAKDIDSGDLEILIQAQGMSPNGFNVTADKALKVPEVLACINVIAQSMSMLPLSVYKETKDGKQKDKENQIYKVIGQKPNDFQSRLEFMRHMTFNAAWQGNAYARKIYLRNKLIGLVPLPNSAVKVKLTDLGEITYEVNVGTSRKKDIQTFTAKEIFHIRGPICPKGFVSESPVALAKDTIATMMAIEHFSSKYFSGGAKAKAVFILPDEGMLKPEAIERLRDSIQFAQNGDKPLIMEGGMTMSKLDYSARESLLADVTGLLVNKLCRVWRIQPHLIQEMSKATYSNIEHQGREFVDHTLMPWIGIWESAIKTQLMDPYDDTTYPKFSASALLRGDNKTRAEVHMKTVGGPIRTQNEARALEDLPPVEGGDVLLSPLNMGSALNNSMDTDKESAEGAK